MADKKSKIEELRNLFSKKESRDNTGSLYSKLYKGLEDIKSFDMDYLKNFEKIKGANYNEKMKHLNDFSFENCCTLLTFLLRGERFSDGLFESTVNSGDVLKLLERAYQAV